MLLRLLFLYAFSNDSKVKLLYCQGHKNLTFFGTFAYSTLWIKEMSKVSMQKNCNCLKTEDQIILHYPIALCQKLIYPIKYVYCQKISHDILKLL